MANRKLLVQQALIAAVRERQSADKSLIESLSIFDFAEKCGVKVRFDAIPSLEEIYWKNPPPKIVVSSLRPAGRQAFNCAHGLGHHIFNHGTKIHEFIAAAGQEQRFQPEEFLADCFAGFLLMPKLAVSRAFAIRHWKPEECSPREAYVIAGYFGVGYTTLVDHMQRTINLISEQKARLLKKPTPKQLRAELLGHDISENVILVDEYWTGRPIDIQIGDLIVLPAGVQHEGAAVEFVDDHTAGSLYRGAARGTARFWCPGSGWASYARVAPRNYIGFNEYRHLEDPDDV